MPQPAPWGPRYGGEPAPGQAPGQNDPARPQGWYQYYPDSYDQDGYRQQNFRNPRTGSDYRLGDDYTMPRPPAGGQTGPRGYQYQYQEQLGSPYSPVSGYPIPGLGQGPDALSGRPPRGHGRRRGRTRRFLRRPTVRVILVVFVVFFAWVSFSVGQAITQSNGLSLSSNLAEWARNHYLGPVVTFGEWLSYNPPPTGGKPAFALTGPSSSVKFKKVRGFKPDIPVRLGSPAGTPLPGEGVWTLRETVRGEPAVYTTFLRVDAVHTSFVAGIASFDQRLVKFQLRPGSQDPGNGFGGGSDYIAPGTRKGLLATFNGGFRLNVSQGGFYLHGDTSGTLADGAASVVYYRNGTIKIGVWGRDVRMTSDVIGVRQNLKPIVDRGQIPAAVEQDVETNFGATLGGAYDVWRSGIGITANGRIIFVYGPALSVHSLASLLQRAGAVEAMQLDINPYWMQFEYYKAAGDPADPVPHVLLPTQQQTAYRYYSPYARDFTAVYSR